MTAPAPRPRELSAARVAGRARFAAWLGAYVRAASFRGATLVPSWSARWDVSRQKVARWLDPTVVDAPITCGDLEALPGGELLALLEAWAEDVRERLAPVAPATDARYIALETAARAGAIAQAVLALASRKPACDAELLHELERELAALETDARQSRLAVQAARAARRGVVR